MATVPTRDLIVSLLLRGSTVFLLVATVVIVVVTAITAGPVGLLLLLFGGIPLLMIVGEFTRYYNFTVAESPDGLRISGGLLQVKSQTIPPGRVQAVEFVQSMLWRRKDWVRVRLNVAGVHRGDDQDAPRCRSGHIAGGALRCGACGRRTASRRSRCPRRPAHPRSAPGRQRAWIQFRQLGVGHDDKVLATSRDAS